MHWQLGIEVMANQLASSAGFCFSRQIQTLTFCYFNEEELGILGQGFLDTVGKFGFLLGDVHENVQYPKYPMV